MCLPDPCQRNLTASCFLPPGPYDATTYDGACCIPTCATRKGWNGFDVNFDHESVSPFAYGQNWDTFQKGPQKASLDQASPAGILSCFPSFVSLCLPLLLPGIPSQRNNLRASPVSGSIFSGIQDKERPFYPPSETILSLLLSFISLICNSQHTLSEEEIPVSDGPDFFISWE